VKTHARHHAGRVPIACKGSFYKVRGLQRPEFLIVDGALGLEKHDTKGILLINQRTKICVVRETEMIADPKRKLDQDDGDSDKRRRQEEALDEALENTFPASDPVSVEQPTTSGRAGRKMRVPSQNFIQVRNLVISDPKAPGIIKFS
jgi:hypothetical protein